MLDGRGAGTVTGIGSAFEPLTAEDPREITEYVLLARLGEGGMGTVYLSYTRGGQPVALKLTLRAYGEDTSLRNPFPAGGGRGRPATRIPPAALGGLRRLR